MRCPRNTKLPFKVDEWTLQFFLWNTVDIHPVLTLEEAMSLIESHYQGVSRESWLIAIRAR
jgi:hypothetical protein